MQKSNIWDHMTSSGCKGAWYFLYEPRTFLVSQKKLCLEDTTKLFE